MVTSDDDTTQWIGLLVLRPAELRTASASVARGTWLL